MITNPSLSLQHPPHPVLDDSDMALFASACSPGNIGAVKNLLLTKININSQFRNGKTPLMVASFAGRTPYVQLLLDHNADVNITCPSGNTALHEAMIHKRDVSCVQMLLENNADPNIVNNDYQTPLLIGAIKAIADIGPDPEIRLPKSVSHAVQIILETNDMCLMVLINHGADMLVCPSPGISLDNGDNNSKPHNQSAAELIVQNSAYFSKNLVNLCQARIDHQMLSQHTKCMSQSSKDVLVKKLKL